MTKPVKLTKDGRTQTVKNPTTATNLRAQGWKVVESSPKPAVQAPSDKGGK